MRYRLVGERDSDSTIRCFLADTVSGILQRPYRSTNLFCKRIEFEAPRSAEFLFLPLIILASKGGRAASPRPQQPKRLPRDRQPYPSKSRVIALPIQGRSNPHHRAAFLDRSFHIAAHSHRQFRQRHAKRRF